MSAPLAERAEAARPRAHVRRWDRVPPPVRPARPPPHAARRPVGRAEPPRRARRGRREAAATPAVPGCAETGDRCWTDPPLASDPGRHTGRAFLAGAGG